MMIGPMKKKMITVGIVAFAIPVVLSVILFTMYSSNKKEEIQNLQTETAVVERYVFSGDMPVNHTITTNDIKLVGVKDVSAPIDSFAMGMEGEIIGRKLKVGAFNRTIIAGSMFYEEDQAELTKDMRRKEFNMITLPSDLVEGDYVDIRILFPTGEDYLVVAAKEVVQLGTNVETNTMFLELSEEELVRLSGAIIESYISSGIHLYAVKYVDNYEQLFKEEPINYVSKYTDALNALIEADYKARYDEEFAKLSPEVNESGEIIYNASGEPSYPPVNVERKTPGDFTLDQIIAQFDLSDEDFDFDANKINKIKASKSFEEKLENVKYAIENNDTILLDLYSNDSINVSKYVSPNYPVRKEVAFLIQNNPNILEILNDRFNYNIEQLEEQRQHLIDTGVFKTDPYTGEVKEDTGVTGAVATAVDAEIEAQKTERQEFLQNLLRNSL